MTWAIFHDSHIRAIGEMISSNSERVLAVVGGALLDDTVRNTLVHRFRNLPDLVKRLLEPEGALGNLGPKIDVLYLLNAFDNRTYGTLQGLAGIRNFFAHHLEASFDSLHDDFTKPLGRLVLHQNRTHYPHHLYGGDGPHQIEPLINKRTQFVVNLKLGLIMLMRDRVSHHLYSNTPLTDEEIKEQFGERPDLPQS